MKKLSWKLLSRLIPMAALAGGLALPGRAATVGTFTGGDPGEGLDLQGNFTYAVNVGPNGAAGRAGDASFSADNTVGVSVIAQNNIARGGWLPANLGDTESDKVLSDVLSSIRWSASPSVVTVRLRVERGIDYKLQLLFGESCCPGRGFNVVLGGVTEAMNFMPGPTQAGEFGDFNVERVRVGAVVTHEFRAASDEYEFVLDGPAADSDLINDRNAILNGFTLERLSPITDTDGDGLPDDWEIKFFTNLDRTGSDDPDADGVLNSQELIVGSSPTDDDSDDDTLKDGDEVSVHKSDPTKRDTDGDRLADNVEVNTLKTNPANVDSDADGAGDYNELRLFTNPADRNSAPKRTTFGAFTGGDADEGLDFDGNIVHAVNANGSTAATIRSANFVPVIADETPGVLIDAGNMIDDGGWGEPAYGDSADDDSLEFVTKSIRWSNAADATTPAVTLTFDNLTPGAEYKAQLIFWEQCCAGRAFDISNDGVPIVDDFNPSLVHGGANNVRQGAVVTHSFIARGSKAVFVFDGRGVTTPEFNDHNAIFNGATLELLAAKVDTDNDGLSDVWETETFGNLAQTSAGDADSDTISNGDEFVRGTNAAKADTDGDGLADNAETTAGTNPFQSDSDGDGLTDGAEVTTHKSNPLVRDSDSDGIDDGVEVAQYQTDPAKKDTDSDGFDDLPEIFSKTDPKSATSKPTKVLLSRFTGADPGEGLDLDGNFIYALNIGGSDAPLVRSAQFVGASQADVPDGVTFSVVNEIGPGGWGATEYGDSGDDDGLELVMQSIRWSAAPARPTYTLGNLTRGAVYKLQLLFGEQCCSRGFDILVNGRLIADEFAPFNIQGRIGNTGIGAVVAYSFIALSDTVEIILDGTTVTTPAFNDHNPTLNGLTLEEVAKNEDKDTDGLSDPWEIENFGDLVQGAAGDPDQDGLSNADELTLGSDPSLADSDSDGLRDGDEKTAGANPNLGDTDGDGLGDAEEVNVTRSSPTKADSDGDGLNDRDEVARYTSDPNKADTDGDGFNDLIEAFSGSSLTSASEKPTTLLVQPITGGDAGEGLDLDGEFIYALNIGGFDGPQVRDAQFVGASQADAPDGLTIVAANEIGTWFAAAYGDTPNDDGIEMVVGSIRWSTVPVRIDLANLIVGNRYKLQLIFAEACCSRAADVKVEGQLVVDEFAAFAVQGGANKLDSGAVIAYEFTAGDNVLNIVLDGTTVTTAAYNDHNPIINGVTLENLGKAPPPTASINISGARLTEAGFAVTFNSESGKTYQLEYKESLTGGAWLPAGTLTATGASSTITDGAADRRARATGFWRVRGQ